MARVVVVGGANMDVKARTSARLIPSTSNPGTATVSPGGVGRNVAENLARLGTEVSLVTIIGEDPLGDQVLRATADAGVDVSHVRRGSGPTGTYTAVLDDSGELVAAVADMAASDAISPLVVRAAGALVATADLLVLDGNLPAATIEFGLELARVAEVPVVLDPVSVPKAARLAPVLTDVRPVWLITPDRAELGALTGLPVGSLPEVQRAADDLHARGATIVWVRLGTGGSLVSAADGGRDWLDAHETVVVDVTGAGDAMLAAFCHFHLTGSSLLEAGRYGHFAAALTVASLQTVRPDLSDELIRNLR